MWTRPARLLLALAALNALVAVAAGAFGAHVLESRLSERHLAIFETACRYHVYHALGMALCAVLARLGLRTLRAGWTMQAGIALFAVSLYILALTGQKFLGAITPLGGALLLTSWALLAHAALKAHEDQGGE